MAFVVTARVTRLGRAGPAFSDVARSGLCLLDQCLGGIDVASAIFGNQRSKAGNAIRIWYCGGLLETGWLSSYSIPGRLVVGGC